LNLIYIIKDISTRMVMRAKDTDYRVINEETK
jgi:hypothetical protein